MKAKKSNPSTFSSLKTSDGYCLKFVRVGRRFDKAGFDGVKVVEFPFVNDIVRCLESFVAIGSEPLRNIVEEE